MAYTLNHADTLSSFQVFSATETGDETNAFGRATNTTGKGDGGVSSFTPEQGANPNAGIVFPGDGAVNWGEVINENILKLFESFASPEMTLGMGDPDPAIVGVPLEGQLWFNNAPATRRLYVYDNTAWQQIAFTSDVPTVPSILNDLDDVNHVMPPANGDVLTWDAGNEEWISATPIGGGGGVAQNLIINPSFDINQRYDPEEVLGDPSPFLPPGPPNTSPGDSLGNQNFLSIGLGEFFESFSPRYFVDRWYVVQTDDEGDGSLMGYVWRKDESDDFVTGSRQSQWIIEVGRTIATGSDGGSRVSIGQVLATDTVSQIPEGDDVALSFDARVGTGFSGSLRVFLRGGESEDEGSQTGDDEGWNNSIDFINQIVTPGATWSRFVLTTSIEGDEGPIKELLVRFDYDTGLGGASGANDYFQIRNIKLEVGSSATAFEKPDSGQELAKCLRYFERHANVHHNVGDVGFAVVHATLAAPKRVIPTLTVRDYGFTTPSHGGNLDVFAVHESAYTLGIEPDGGDPTWTDIVVDIDAEL